MGISKKLLSRPLLAYVRGCAKPWKLMNKKLNSSLVYSALIQNWMIQENIERWERGEGTLSWTDDEAERQVSMMIDSGLRDMTRIVDKLSRISEKAVGICDVMSHEIEALKEENDNAFPALVITFGDVEKEMKQEPCASCEGYRLGDEPEDDCWHCHSKKHPSAGRSF